MGDAIDKVIALAGSVHVRGHKRTSVKGKVFDVDAYVRNLRKMTDVDLDSEIRSLLKQQREETDGNMKNQLRTRHTFAVREKASRARGSDKQTPSSLSEEMDKKLGTNWDDVPQHKPYSPPATLLNKSEEKTYWEAIQSKSDSQLKIMSVDRNLRAYDRKNAGDELLRRQSAAKSDEAPKKGRSFADDALDEWFKKWKKGAGLNDIAYTTSKPMDKVKAALENSPYAEKRGTKWFPKS